MCLCIRHTVEKNYEYYVKCNVEYGKCISFTFIRNHKSVDC